MARIHRSYGEALGAMSEDKARVAAEIRRMGALFDEDVLRATYALYVPLQQRTSREGVSLERDLAYGDDPRHRLDVFTPGKRPDGAPVVAYFHGGGYIAGERSPVPGVIYDNVPRFFARHGMVGVNATYRLAPAHKWPSGGEDVGRVVRWLRANAAQYGGDPRKIFLLGQSAGATHVATWTFMEGVHGADGPGIAGAMLISGVYAAQHPDYGMETPRANQFAYYGDDLSKWPAMAPFDHVKPDAPPVLMTVSEYEPYYFQWPSLALAGSLLRRTHRMPRLLTLADHNHVSPALQIGCEIDTLGETLLQFVTGCP
jgi:triacylglycerol lipase